MKTSKTKEANAMQETAWHEGDNLLISAKYGMHYIPGNRLPYFSITGETLRPAEPGDRRILNRNGKYWTEDSGGCIHDVIREHLPRLRPLLRFHLCSQDGTPFYYRENAQYWLEKHYGAYKMFRHSEPEGRRPGEPDPLKAFLSLMCIPEGEFINFSPPPLSGLNRFLDSRLIHIQSDFHATMAQFGIEYIIIEG